MAASIKTKTKSGESPSLRSYLAELPEEELFRISEPTELDYLPTALVLELEKRNREPVIMVENPKGFTYPVVMNLFASRERIAGMVGAQVGGFGAAWTKAIENLIPAIVRSSGPVQECVIQGDALDAGQLPISRHFAKDAGRYIGSGVLICKDPDTGVRNLSYQRLQLKGPNRFGASLHSHGHIWDHLKRCEAKGRNLDVAVVIGMHPTINVAAAAKVAMEVDELEVAGALLGCPIELVKCRTIDVEVPAEAEIVLEGQILANVNEDEGPYGEYTGYSTHSSTRNVFVVNAITHRRNPIFHDIIPGGSAEHLLLGRAAKEPHVFMRLKEMVPELHSLNVPRSGRYFHAYMSLNKASKGAVRHAMMHLLALDPYLKLVIAVDNDVDVFNEQDVLWALATRFQADSDMFMIPQVLCNRLDPSSKDGMSAKLALDATAPLQWDVERNSMPDEAMKWAANILAQRKY